LLDEARKHFDYIIIDAPPLGVFTDANLLINRADAALLVVRASKTRFSVVDRLLEQLPRERKLGVVLNRAESSTGRDRALLSAALSAKAGGRRGSGRRS
jgi:Mrp family chromosome partitioning ATPase